MTISAFFYGTLLHPKVLKRVIGNDGSHLTICPAVLLVCTYDIVYGQGVVLMLAQGAYKAPYKSKHAPAFPRHNGICLDDLTK